LWQKKFILTGRGYALADDVDLLARLLRRQHRTRQRSQRAALGRRDHEVRIHDTRHRRQHDRELGLEKVEKSRSGHMVCSFSWVEGSAGFPESGQIP